MRFIKRVFWFCVVLFVVVLAGVYWYLTPERLQALIQPRLEKALGREVVFDDVQWGVLDGPGVTILGLSVKQRVGTGTFLKADRAQVAVSPGALLTGDGKLGELVLEGGVALVVVDKNGQVNAGDLFGKKGGLWLPVDRVRVIDGTLRVENRRTGRTTVLADVNGRVRGSLGDEGIVLDADVVVGQVVTVAKGDTSQVRDLSVAGRVRFAEDQLVAEDLLVGFGPFAAKVSGLVRDPWRSFVVDLKAKDQMLDMVQVQDFLILSGVLSNGARLTGAVQAQVALTGRWPFEVRGKVTVDGLTVTDRTRLALPIVEGEGTLFLERDRIRIHGGRARVGRSDIALSGVVNRVWSGQPLVSFAWVSQVLDLDELMPDAPPVAWGWPGAAVAAKSEALALFAKVRDMEGSIRVNEGVWHGAVFKNLETALRAQNGRMHIGPVFGQVFEGALNGAVILDHGDVSGSLSLVNARAKQLVDSLGWSVPVYGAVNVTARISGVNGPFVNASGVVHMAEGRIVKWDFLQRELHSVEQLGLLTADEVPLKDVKVVFDVRGDEVTLNGTQLTAADMVCTVGGSGHLKGALNYVLDVDVPASRIKVAGFNVGQALGAFLGRNATIPVRVHVGGVVGGVEVKVGVR